MTFFGFYAPSAAWMFALLAPLILFYFLKLKRPRRVIPSLVLWQQVMSDQRVNSPFQRFKRNILLLIQILLLMAVVLAAMQPYWRGPDSRRQRLPILVDNSASMAALDKEGGQSRLDAAKERVRRQIDGMLPDQELCLISFSRTARKRVGFTNDKALLRAALDEIQVEDVPSDLEDALRMAQALARTAAFDEVLLLSDGNVPVRSEFELSFKLNYQQLPPAGPNMGITALNARRTQDGHWEVFVSVDGSAAAEGTATLALLQDGEKLPDVTISMSRKKSERALFRVSGEKAASLKAVLKPDGFDSLASDNTAALDLPAVRDAWVFCPKSLPAWRHALAALPGVRLLPEKDEEKPQSAYDLVITDRAQDLALNARDLLAVGLVPGDLQRLVAVNRDSTQVVDWQRKAALLQYVELADLMLLDQPRYNAGMGDSDCSNLGYDILVHGRVGPLVVEKNEPGRRATWLLFHTDRSTLPYRVGFPVLVANAVRLAMQDAGLAEVAAVHTGVLPPMAFAAEQRCAVKDPGGASREETADKSGWLQGVAAPRAGVYTISGGGRQLHVGASLLSVSETQLAATDRLQFNEGLKVTASATAKSDKPLWAGILIAGLGLLLLEWWFYQRRPGERR